MVHGTWIEKKQGKTGLLISKIKRSTNMEGRSMLPILPQKSNHGLRTFQDKVTSFHRSGFAGAWVPLIMKAVRFSGYPNFRYPMSKVNLEKKQLPIPGTSEKRNHPNGSDKTQFFVLPAIIQQDGVESLPGQGVPILLHSKEDTTPEPIEAKRIR